MASWMVRRRASTFQGEIFVGAEVTSAMIPLEGTGLLPAVGSQAVAVNTSLLSRGPDAAPSSSGVADHGCLPFRAG